MPHPEDIGCRSSAAAPRNAEIHVDARPLASAEKLSPWLRAAALRMMHAPQGRLTVGAFLRDASHAHLEELFVAGRRARAADSQALCELHLLAMLLANGEALPVRMSDDISALARRVLLYAQAEVARRAGKLSFDPLSLSLETFAIPGVRVALS